MNTKEENRMENPKELKYTKEHEWIRVKNDIGTIGITYFAQHALTDVVFAELPEIGKKVTQFKTAATVESVKSVSDVYAPVSGEVVEANEQLKAHPELINSSPYGDGWIFKIRIADKNELNSLMSSQEYAKIAEEE